MVYTICGNVNNLQKSCILIGMVVCLQKKMDIIQELVDRVDGVALTHRPDDAELFIELLTLQKELEVKLLEFDKLYRELLKSK